MKRTILNALSILNDSEKRKFSILSVLNLLISIIDIGSLALLVLLISFYTQGAGSSPFFHKVTWLFSDGSVLPISVFLFLFILKSLLAYWVVAAQYTFVYE